jgi:hypothetical protein
MKFLFLSTLLVLSSTSGAKDPKDLAQVPDVLGISDIVDATSVTVKKEQIKAEINAEIHKEKAYFKALGLKGALAFKDFPLSTQNTEQLTNLDNKGSLSKEQMQDNESKYQQIIIELATNDERSVDENMALTQIEANLLVKYFQELNLNPQKLISAQFKSGIKISGENWRDRLEVIRAVENIAKTRIDMNSFLYEDVRCFFRGYSDPNAALDESRKFEKSSHESSAMAPELSGLIRRKFENSLKRSDEVTIGGKCRGWGLCSLPEITLYNEDGEQLFVKVFNCENSYAH